MAVFLRSFALLVFCVSLCATPHAYARPVPGADWQGLVRLDPEDSDFGLRMRFAQGQARAHDHAAAVTDSQITIADLTVGMNAEQKLKIPGLRVTLGAGLYLSDAETYGGVLAIGTDRGVMFSLRATLPVLQNEFVRVDPFLQVTYPNLVSYEKHCNPRFDLISGGFAVEARMTAAVAAQSYFQVGSGSGSGSAKHNPAVGFAQFLVLETTDWWGTGKGGVRLGFLGEADIGGHSLAGPYQRFDPSGTNSTVIGHRVGAGIFPFIGLSKNVAFEFGYERNLAGQFLPWTYQITAALRSIL